MICSHTEGPRHSCAYVDARNARVPAAVKYADGMWGAEPPLQHKNVEVKNRDAIVAKWQADWNQAFHCAMGLSFRDEPDAVYEESHPLGTRRSVREQVEAEFERVDATIERPAPFQFALDGNRPRETYEYLGEVEEGDA